MTASDPLRIGILGCGGFAGAHARRYRESSETRVVALCDLDPARIDSLLARRLDGYEPVPERYDDPEAMFAGAALDGVSILTPHALHAEHTRQALNAGCHVLVEKPMVTDPSAGAAVCAAARAAGRYVLPGYNPVYQPAVQWLRRAVADGRFGPLRLVTAYLAQNWQALTAGSWRHDPAIAGGGQSIDSGSHLLAGLSFCLGGLPERVTARYENRGSAVDVDSVMLFDYADGLHASVAIGGDSAVDGSFAAFVFARGRVEIDLWSGEWVRLAGVEAGDDPPPPPEAGASVNRCFIDVLRGRLEPPVDAAFGLGQARLHAALQRAAREDRPVALAEVA